MLKGQAVITSLWIWAASAVWSWVNRCVRLAVQRGWIKPLNLGVRVISIGNIQAGGAGKTPLVAQTAREAISRGLIPVILCRGYHSPAEKKGGIIQPGLSPALASIWGDEAALLHDLVPEAWIGVGKSRGKQAYDILQLLADSPKERILVILDDGFQHWGIKKDLEVLALTSMTPGKILFRENLASVRYADLLVWTKGQPRPGLFRDLLVEVEYEIPPPDLQCQPTWLVTGVADGRHVFESMRGKGYVIQRHVVLPDHAVYSKEEIVKLLRDCFREGCQMVTTGKDWVKWREAGIPEDQVKVIEPNLRWVSGWDLWNQKLWRT